MDQDQSYDNVIESIADRYHGLAIDYLTRIADLLRDNDMSVDGPYTMHDDEYRWTMVVQCPGTTDKDDRVVLTVEIAEQRSYEDGICYGINFGLDIVEYDGLVIGGLIPYNYTSECWVDSRDADAVQERWEELTSANISEIPSLVMRERTT